MSKQAICQLCAEPLEEDPNEHNLILCQRNELIKARQTIKQLKSSLDSWKTAWYELREIIGRLWWHHPAIEDDKSREYYQHNGKQSND